METLEGLRAKLDSAAEINSVVRTMKAVAASNIGQYEQAVSSLADYYQTLTMGLTAFFKANHQQNGATIPSSNQSGTAAVLVFGSDQGLVGRFNDVLAEFLIDNLQQISPMIEVWAVGERISLLLKDEGLNCPRVFSVPGAVESITPLVGEILIKAQERMESGEITSFHIFHNRPKKPVGYAPFQQRLLPLDEKWQQKFETVAWPTNNLPQVIGNKQSVLLALVREFLFVSLFRACAESLAGENASRLNAMQRAEKNIEELLEQLQRRFHRLRQSSIDEELFDVVSGFEALKDAER